MRKVPKGWGTSRRVVGFTLIELLVVIAIIALLISILLPSLSRARDQAKAVKCGVGARNVGVAVTNYVASSKKGVFPPSYVYPKDAKGNYDLQNQDANHPFGYLHWSWFLYGKGEVDRSAFECPKMQNLGMPRTNPGKDQNDWDEKQEDQNGNTGANPANLEDKQAPRMAFTANAAIMPRNKFTTALSGGPRVNRLVSDNEIKKPGSTVLITEFLDGLPSVSENNGSNYLSKSHRPVQAFYHIGSGADEYAASPSSPGFVYGLQSDQVTYGVAPLKDVLRQENVIGGSVNGVEINAVGRHHPGGDKIYGGTSNFLFVDGHVDRTTILDTMKKKQWGGRYYSLSGESQVLNVYGE